MIWHQRYDPFGNAMLSTLAAALPLLVMLGLLATHKVRAHIAATIALFIALLVATTFYEMPLQPAIASAVFGAAYGLFPIGWIVLNVIFLYNLSSERGHFDVLRDSVTHITNDRRLQLLLIAFAFGAFFEGAAGFGTPVAVTAALLLGLGFAPLEASGLSLIANTAPVAFGALGTPIIALQGVTGLDIHALSSAIGHQLPVFSLIIPFWLMWAYAGRRGLGEVWPAVLVAGVTFAVPQFLIATLHGPWLVDVIAAICSLACTTAFLRVWKPRDATGKFTARSSTQSPAHLGTLDELGVSRLSVSRTPSELQLADTLTRPVAEKTIAENVVRPSLREAWLPWIILSVLVFIWGIPQFKTFVNGISAPKLHVFWLDMATVRVPPIAPSDLPEPAIFTFNWLSASGTAILFTALISGRVMGYTFREMLRVYIRTLSMVRVSLITIATMMALGYVTRYAGLDGVMGLAFAKSGTFYPFFGTMLGWLGVALTGSDTSSNVLFGNLQTISARQLGIDPVLMAAANSSGGVMGKMIDAQSIVVASTATRWFGHEGRILRYVFFHSVALAMLVGCWVMAQAYLF